MARGGHAVPKKVVFAETENFRTVRFYVGFLYVFVKTN